MNFIDRQNNVVYSENLDSEDQKNMELSFFIKKFQDFPFELEGAEIIDATKSKHPVCVIL